VPDLLKIAEVTPVYKKEERNISAVFHY